MVNVRMDKLIRLCNIIFVSINSNNGKNLFSCKLVAWEENCCFPLARCECQIGILLALFAYLFLQHNFHSNWDAKVSHIFEVVESWRKREISRQTMDKHGDRILFHIIIAINFESMTAIANDTLIVNDVLIKSMVFAFHMDPFMYRFSFPLFTSFDPHSILLLMVNLKRFKQIIFTLSFGLIVV